MNTHTSTRMKAAVYEQYGPPEVVDIRDVPMPRPKANEVLVQINASTVNSGDWRARSLEMPRGFGALGRLVFGIRKPRQPILGTEFSGRISEVGSNVTRFNVGDEVFGFPSVQANESQSTAHPAPLVSRRFNWQNTLVRMSRQFPAVQTWRCRNRSGRTKWSTTPATTSR